MKNNFAGKHLLMDFVSYNKRLLSNISPIYNYLLTITKDLGMTLIIPPIVVEFPFANEASKLYNDLISESTLSLENSEILKDFNNKLKLKETKESGISGITIWAESHASIHTWPEDDFASIDIYSCKDFDEHLAIAVIREEFDVWNASVTCIERYLDLPHKVKSWEF